MGFIYGPVAELEYPSLMVKIVFFPTIILSGLWLWKGQVVKKWFSKE